MPAVCPLAALGAGMRRTIRGVTDLSAAYPLLAALDGPGPLHDMDDAQLEALASEMRAAIIDTVSHTGGHLGSSLGTVELSIALHAELESPRDRILWDVGHQAYGHKLLTGRSGPGYPRRPGRRAHHR